MYVEEGKNDVMPLTNYQMVAHANHAPVPAAPWPGAASAMTATVSQPRRADAGRLEVPQPGEPSTPVVPGAPVPPAVPDPGTPADPEEPATVPGPAEPATPVVPETPEPAPDSQ